MTDSEVPVQNLEPTDFAFKFTSHGQTVAVFYDSELYIGQVLQVHSPEVAYVSFMTSPGKDNLFKWPQAEDIDKVAAKFVFDSEFEVLPMNRTWHVEKVRWGVLLAQWHTYQRLFC